MYIYFLRINELITTEINSITDVKPQSSAGHRFTWMTQTAVKKLDSDSGKPNATSSPISQLGPFLEGNPILHFSQHLKMQRGDSEGSTGCCSCGSPVTGAPFSGFPSPGRSAKSAHAAPTGSSRADLTSSP